MKDNVTYCCLLTVSLATTGLRVSPGIYLFRNVFAVCGLGLVIFVTVLFALIRLLA